MDWKNGFREQSFRLAREVEREMANFNGEWGRGKEVHGYYDREDISEFAFDLLK